MSGTVAEKIINGHIVEGKKARGEEVALKIDLTIIHCKPTSKTPMTIDICSP
jgi:homoaconitase/3-isopropylmalate dehydratase large subunit